jgi:hypothetical protein
MTQTPGRAAKYSRQMVKSRPANVVRAVRDTILASGFATASSPVCIFICRYLIL